MADFFIDQRSVLPLDWNLRAEYPPGDEASQRQRLVKGGAIVVVYRDDKFMNTESRFNSPLTQSVIEAWRQVESNYYFDVYQPVDAAR